MPVLSQSRYLRYFTFSYLYVMQGIPAGFRANTIFNYLIEKGLSASAVGTFVLIVGLPWSFQFVWGPVVDRFQYSVIGHRKQWVVLTQLMAVGASLGLLFIDDPLTQIGLLSALFFVHSLFASIQDTSVDAMAIAITPQDERGRVNALMRVGFLLGTSLGSAGLAIALHHEGFRFAALLQSAALLFFTVITFFIKLEHGDKLLPSLARQRARARVAAENPPLRRVFQELAQSVRQPSSLRIFACIAAAYLACTVFYRSYVFTLIHDLHWPATEVSVLEGSWVNLLAVGVLIAGGYVADRLGALRLQRWMLAVIVLSLAGFSAMHGYWSHPGVATGGIVLTNLFDPLMSVAALPLLMNLCDERVAGSQFTAYMALINFGDVIGAKISGWALEVTTSPVIGVACATVALLALWELYQVRAPAVVAVARVA